MTTKVKTLGPDTDVLHAVEFLLKHQISGAPVVDGGKHLVGIISEKDCLRLLAEGVDSQFPEGKVSDYMTVEVKTIPPKMDIFYAAGLFLTNVFRRFPVVEDDVLVGQISRRDVLRAIKHIQAQVL